MQDHFQDFRQLIEHWPSKRAFGRAVTGEPEAGRILHRRNRVPRKHWPALIRAARARDVDLDEATLVRLYEAGRGQGR